MSRLVDKSRDTLVKKKPWSSQNDHELLFGLELEAPQGATRSPRAEFMWQMNSFHDTTQAILCVVLAPDGVQLTLQLQLQRQVDGGRRRLRSGRALRMGARGLGDRRKEIAPRIHSPHPQRT